ncbi:adenosylcobinamide-phosphate synthase [Prauserella shujinwangii]|uniref:Cobalamin biosynthesis protein CobD n=1 Tax=Prauserella shujinwangii TaxID=1453103 RepID=A0A2T0LM62_9PSEU|nr:adenosylcobinamide-phosphate synthase [Prauserella shujinwangii]
MTHPARERPVAAFTRAARAVESRIYADHPLPGAVHAGALTGTAVALGLLAERATRHRPVLQAAGTAVATWLVLGGTRVATDGAQLARDLETGRLDGARELLAGWDSRRTADLDVIGLSRVSVETVAEHTADQVVAPLAWGAVAGVPGLLGARAVGVLRTVASARDPRYRRFGLATARLDELVQLLPTRAAAALTVAGAPVVGGSAGAAWRAWRRDTVLHPSPNAGRVEAAFAGALEVRLGGRAAYPHGVAELPVLGDGRNPDAGHVTRAVELSRVVGWLAGGASALLALVLGARRRSRRRAR